MLRATRRLLRPGGRTAFTTIHLANDLEPEQRRRAVAAGPPAVVTRSPSYARLLRSAGLSVIHEVDVTDDYRERLRVWLREATVMESELADAEPPGAFEERMGERRSSLAAVDAGLLRRSLFVAMPRRGSA